MIWSIVLNQLMRHIIQGELSFGDTIREASDQSTEVTWILDVFGERFVTVYKAIKEREYETFFRVISPWEREFLLLNV